MSFRKKPKTINPDDVDPSVFYYDEVYDDMKNEEEAQKQDAARTHKQEGSKYINVLIESAELRKNQKEIRKIKRYAKDREEAEKDGSINESDVYITSSYKKKLDEMRELDEKLRLKTRGEEERSFRVHRQKSSEDKSDFKEDDAGPSYREKDSKSQIMPSEETRKQLEHGELVKSGSRIRDLRNSEHRRCYLEEVLAKRTVGPRFNEALQRYKLRKDHT